MKEKQDYFNGLSNIGTVDGRERLFTEALNQYFSEGVLHRTRGFVQIKNLIALLKTGALGLPEFTEEQIAGVLEGILKSFDPQAVAEYDHFGRNGQGPFEHDVKSVEIYLKERFIEHGLGHYAELLHFPMTSEDANNISWNLNIRGGINNGWLPVLLTITDTLAVFAKECSDVPVLGITHGMPATPTTFGKRFAYFLARFMNTLDQLASLQLSAKYSGPTGNHNAVTIALPDFDFQKYAKNFVESMGFVYVPCEHQRNSHVDIVRILNEIAMINIVAADLCEHIRHGVMMKWLFLEGESSHVGSSVIPHKINPWFFEVAQGYLEQSTAMIHAAGPHLIQSVFERDLTDHPWERSYGEMIGKSVIGLNYIAQGLPKVKINKLYALQELKASPEVLSEAIQIVGRKFGVTDSYMKLKEITRGRQVTLEMLHTCINEIIPDSPEKEALLKLQPEYYIGKAPEIALQVVSDYKNKNLKYVHGFFHPLSGIQAVLFDFDGTLQLGDKDELYARLGKINKTLQLGFSQEQLFHFGNRSDYREMKKMMVQEYNVLHPESCISEDEFQKVNDSISGTFDHLFISADGAKEILQGLKEKGYKTGLVTTRGKQSLYRILDNYGIREMLDVIIDRDACHERKPNPKPIAQALEQLGVSADSAIYIGDKQVDDIVAGNALGMKTVLISEESLDTYGAVPNFCFANLKQVSCFLLN